MLLPWLDQKPLYDSINFDLSVIGHFDGNDTLRASFLSVYVCVRAIRTQPDMVKWRTLIMEGMPVCIFIRMA
jgi:hypothetical protein